ncbi:MAG: hypothetical protein ACI4JK_02050 [Oscillospiraceae bacterium]
MLDLGLKEIPIQLMCGRVKVPICTKAVWNALSTFDGSDKAAVKLGGMLLDGIPLDICDSKLLIAVYTESLKLIREQTGLEVPYYPGRKNTEDEVKYTAYTVTDKLVADYANMSIYEIDNISILDYWLLERDAFIEALSKTKEGREYLNNAYRIKQVDADEDLKL